MVESIGLNMIPKGIAPMCYAAQYDVGRSIRVNLFSGINPYVLDGTETVTLNVRKPDNTIVTAELTNTSASYVTFETTEQMCAVAGINKCTISVAKSSNTIASLNFFMSVQADVLSSGIPSESVIRDLASQVAALVDLDLEDYYTKSQTDSKISALIDDSESSESKTYSSDKIEEVIENAFNSIVTVSGSVASFETPVENAILSAGITLVEIQESGTPTPSTPKTITTYSQAVISQADGDMTVQDTRTISLGATYTKGSLAITDKGNGYASVKFTPERKAYDLSGLSWQVHNQGFYYADLPSDLKHFDADVLANIIAEKYQVQTAQWIYGHGTTVGYIAINGGKLWVTDSATPSGLFVDDLAEPTEIDLTDISSIITLIGENNIYANTNGNTTVTYEISIEAQIDSKADKSDTYTKEQVKELIAKVDDQGFYMQTKLSTLSSATTFPPKIDNKKNAVLEFMGYFNSFTSLTFGHGYGSISGSYLVVDDTNVTVYYSAPAQQKTQVAHGLTISDFIHVTVKQNNKAHADIQITTASGNFETTNVVWVGCQGSVYANVGATMNDVVVTAVYRDFNENVFLYGDSFVSLDDPARYPYYLIKNEYTRFLLDGWAGRASGDALLSFNNEVEYVTPKYAIWAIGMNNPDNSAINPNWLNDTQSFIQTCLQKGITPILTTTPNTPTHDNTYKNAWVKASGYRYVDFAKSVGAEAPNSTWYAGMLYTDNVHPTILGAKALYTRLITDAPEIMR